MPRGGLYFKEMSLISTLLDMVMLRRMWLRWVMCRQRVVNRVVSALYGQPMQVLPAGHVGLAGALVLWMVQDGGRQMVMVRTPDAKDARARFVSCLGLGRHADMGLAMRAAVRAQLGDAFANTLKLERVVSDRVASAPMFTYTDEGNGIMSPVQVLTWVMAIEPVQLELLKLSGMELVVVGEGQLKAGKTAGISPTHVAIWKSVQRHLPHKVLPREEDVETREERLAEQTSRARSSRTVH